MVWTGAKNLAPMGIPYPDRPARLSYPCSYMATVVTEILDTNGLLRPRNPRYFEAKSSSVFSRNKAKKEKWWEKKILGHGN